VTLGGDEVVLLLNQARYLSLRHISEPEQNSLRLVVQEAIADRIETASSPDPASPFAEILKGATLPVKSTEGCRTFVAGGRPLLPRDDFDFVFSWGCPTLSFLLFERVG